MIKFPAAVWALKKFFTLPRFNNETVNSQQSTVNSQQSTVNSQQSTVNSQQSTVNSQQSTVNSRGKNNNLHAAKRGKNDEFYTQLSDIERELKHYTAHFKNKVVYCNCDDPRVSNFFHYFSFNFERLGLKKLITTCYKNQNSDLFSQNNSEQAVYLIYEGDKDGDRIPSPDEIEVKPLEGDGDFRSAECIELLKQADIVVTNPPFSLFREYVAQLVEYEKKFIIIGNKNAITYKEIFPLIKENKIWVGVTPMGTDMLFDLTPEYAQKIVIEKKLGSSYRMVDGVPKGRAQACWFTNLEHAKRHEELILWRTYTADKYPRYDNYHAINIDKVADIPVDYDGAMGVPITFLDKYNPEQFEIIGCSYSYGEPIGYHIGTDFNVSINNVNKYKRLFIKNKKFRKVEL